MRSIKYRVITLLLCVAFCCTLWPVSTFAAIEDIESVADLLTDIILGTYETDEESNSDPTAPATDGTASTDNSDSAPDGTADSSPANGSTQENTPADSTETSAGNSDTPAMEPDSTGDSSENVPETSPEPATDTTSTDSSSTDTSTATTEPTETVPECTCGTSDGIHTENCALYTAPEAETEDSATPDCDCGVADSTSPVSNHNDSCAIKLYYNALYAENDAETLAEMWSSLPADAQTYILNDESWTDQTKRAALVALIENGTTDPEDPEAEDEFVSYGSDTINNLTVSAYADFGVFPENTEMCIGEAVAVSDSDIKTAIKSLDNFSDFELLNTYAVDITFLSDNAEIQPEGSVIVNFQLPSSIISSKANTIVVIHLGNNGAEVVGCSYIDSFSIDQSITVSVGSFSNYVVAFVNNKYPAKLMSTVLRENPDLDARYDIVTFPVTLNDFNAQQFNAAYENSSPEGLEFTTGKAGTGMNLGSLSATQGIVSMNLSNSGYPITYGSDRGEMIFSPSNIVNGSTVAGKSAHANVNFQFIYDNQTGYYTYNSGANHAQYNSTNNTVELYAETLAPFNYRTDLLLKITANEDYAHMSTAANGTDIVVNIDQKTSYNMFRITDYYFPDVDTDLYTHMYLRMKASFGGNIKCKIFYEDGSDETFDPLTVQEDTWADYVFGPFAENKVATHVRFYVPSAEAGDTIQITTAGVLHTENSKEVNFAGLYPFNTDIRTTFAGSDKFSLTDWEYRIQNGVNADLLSSRVLYNTASGESSLTDTYAYFAMAMEVSFYIPVGGQVNNEDIVFHFNGDDDLWVFVDDQLALDIGGAHTDVAGSINFRTGATYVENVRSLTDTTTTGKGSATGALASSQYSEGQYHTMKIFYMERAGTNSNCLIKFNLPIVPKGSVEVSKTVQSLPTANALTSESFEFVITTGSSNSATPLKNTTFYRVSSNNMEKTQTDENGKFSLKHGERAVFEIDENIDVTVTELSKSISGYSHKSTTVNSTAGYSLSLRTTANTTQTFAFVNVYEKALADLTITKTGANTTLDPNQSFLFHVSGPNSFSMDVIIVGNGSVTIKDLPVGNYTVTEDESWSWRYTVDGENGKSVTVDSTEPNSVTFNNTRDKTQWLDGDSYCENIFKNGITKNESQRVLID